MAFNTPTKSSKNQFVARLISKKTAKTASWVNLTDEFARNIFGCEVKDITATMALDILPNMFNSPYLEIAVTDLTTELTVVSPEEY